MILRDCSAPCRLSRSVFWVLRQVKIPVLALNGERDLQVPPEQNLPAISAKDQELRVELPEAPLPVDADPVRIEQVITNLLTNANRYTDPGGTIWLSAVRREYAAHRRIAVWTFPVWAYVSVTGVLVYWMLYRL